MQQEILSVTPVMPQTLEHFIPGHNLEMLFSLFHFRSKDRVELPIYIFGESKSGKTHLLRGALPHHPSSLYINVIQHPELLPLNLNLLQRIAIDNIDHLSPEGEMKLFNLYNYYLQHKKHKILLSGAVPPARLPLRNDLRTRICSSLSYRIQALTDKEKKDYLMLLARSRGLSLKEDVARFILNHVQTDMNSLQYWLDQIDKASLREKKNITESLVRHVLQRKQLTT